MIDQIAPWLLNGGPIGIFALYLIWREASERKERAARIETDKALAATLASLVEIVRLHFREEHK